MTTGLLEDSICYLSGAIENSGDDGNSWRNRLSSVLSERYGAHGWNPLNKHKYFNALDGPPEADENLECLREQGDFDGYAKKIKVIRAYDLRMVDKADFLIVRLFKTVRSCGTWEELFFANREKKPIIVWYNGEKKDISGWLFGAIPHNLFFSSLDSIIDYLDSVDKGILDSVNEDRWRL